MKFRVDDSSNSPRNGEYIRELLQNARISYSLPAIQAAHEKSDNIKMNHGGHKDRRENLLFSRAAILLATRR
jgi:hypothetical protein